VEFFKGIFIIAVLAIIKAPQSSSWFWQQSENKQASGPQSERIKDCLVGGLCSVTASSWFNSICTALLCAGSILWTG